MLDLCFYIGSFYFCSCILSYVIFYAFNIISYHFNYHFVSRILNFLHIFVKHVMCQIYYDAVVIPKGKVTAEQTVMLNKVKEELPSTSDVAKADDIELQEIVHKGLNHTRAGNVTHA